MRVLLRNIVNRDRRLGGGRVVDQSTAGGAVSGKLDPGESSMDLQGAP